MHRPPPRCCFRGWVLGLTFWKRWSAKVFLAWVSQTTCGIRRVSTNSMKICPWITKWLAIVSQYCSLIPSMKKLSLASVFLVVAHVVNGQITFSFHDGNATIGSGLDLDELSSGTSLVSGVTMTAEAFQGTVSAGTVFNGAGTSFGINASGADTETQRFDNDLGVGNFEAMVFSFNSAGTFQSIDLRYIADLSAEATLSFDGGSSFELFAGSPNEFSASDDVYTITESFLAGQQITLAISNSATAGENFSLESFTINVSAIPEPSTYALIFGGLALGFVVWKRRKAA